MRMHSCDHGNGVGGRAVRGGGSLATCLEQRGQAVEIESDWDRASVGGVAAAQVGLIWAERCGCGGVEIERCAVRAATHFVDTQVGPVRHGR